MTRAFVGLGANLGDPVAQVRLAVSALSRLPDTHVLSCSSLWRTPAWGPVKQPDYVNAVVALDTTLTPVALLAALLAIERDNGRVRGAERYGPRTLDLDLLLHGEACIDEPGVQLPHPRMTQRAFVLLPLAEIAPDLVLPCGLGPVRDLCESADASDCVALGPLL